jgi:hypothetical protein
MGLHSFLFFFLFSLLYTSAVIAAVTVYIVQSLLTNVLLTYSYIIFRALGIGDWQVSP